MRMLLLLLSPLTFAGGLAAQLVTTLSPVGVATAAAGSPTQFAGVQANALAAPLNLSTSPLGGGVNAATLWCGVLGGSPLGSTTRIESSLFLLDTVPRSAGTTASGAATGFAHGPVEFLVVLSGAAGRVGQLRLLSTSVTSAPSATTTLVNQVTIDVYADGIPEFTSPSGQVVLPVVFGASGSIPVKVTMENHAAGTGMIVSQSSTDVVLEMDPVTVAPYGLGCGGATSSGVTSGLALTPAGYSTITLSSAGGFANAPVVSAFGTQNVGPLLPGGCALLTDATILVPMLSDGAGAATHTFLVHATAVGLLYQQFVPIDLAAFAFRASNGLAITAW